MEEKQKTVVGIGELLWDMLPGGKVPGGAPANFSYHASRFGLRGAVVSAVGPDVYGREITEILAAKGLDLLVATVDYPTGTVGVTLNGNGVPRYDIAEGVAWDNIPFSPEAAELARGCVAVCFGTLAQRSPVSRAAIRQFLDTTGNSVTKVLDINLRQQYYDRDTVHESLLRCNILKINDEEVQTVGRLLGMEGLGEEDTCLRLLREYDLHMVIETRGAEGSTVFAPGEISRLATPKVPVCDTVGAGDSFTGTFVAALVNGKPLREAHRMAVEISAWVCTRPGAMPQYPGK